MSIVKYLESKNLKNKVKIKYNIFNKINFWTNNKDFKLNRKIGDN